MKDPYIFGVLEGVKSEQARTLRPVFALTSTPQPILPI